MEIEKKIGYTILGIALGGIVMGSCNGSNRSTKNDISNEFRMTYEQALFKYADTNKDGLVSTYEKDEFDRKLFKDKGVHLLPDQFPKNKSGEEIPTEVVTEWIRNYNPEE